MASSSFVVIGGGIAGVTCIEQLSFLDPSATVVLLSAAPLVKSVTNVKKLTRNAEEFDVRERSLEEFAQEHPKVSVVRATVSRLDPVSHEVHTEAGDVYRYAKLCICTGATAKVIDEGNPFVLGIRDTETVTEFQARLRHARRIVIVGNGGIATELAYEVSNCQVVWAIKDDSIGAAFFDCGAAQFFLPHLSQEKPANASCPLKRHKYVATLEDTGGPGPGGSALGPDWSGGLQMTGVAEAPRQVCVEHGCEVKSILTPEQVRASGKSTTELEGGGGTGQSQTWNVYVELSNGKIYGCDFVISATGVIPNAASFISDIKMELAQDGGIKVNGAMESSVADVYAAGDVCSAAWDHAPHWFQMRLWTQARHMGAYAARCMLAHLPVLQDFCFELFTHVTKFFGYKVVLLGLFNGQGLGTDYEILLRVTKGVEYVKVVLKGGRMQGAILVGDTDLEETFENLILNQMDLSQYGEDLLDPNIDIEDYFD